MTSYLRFCINNEEDSWDFSSKELILRWCKKVITLEEMEQGSLSERLEAHSISKIVVKPLSSAAAYLLPNIGDNTFTILLNVAFPLEWSLAMGHEICHTYFFSSSKNGARRTPFYRMNPQYKIEEEICEQFAKMWKERKRNSQEIYELLAPATRRSGTFKVF